MSRGGSGRATVAMLGFVPGEEALAEPLGEGTTFRGASGRATGCDVSSRAAVNPPVGTSPGLGRRSHFALCTSSPAGMTEARGLNSPRRTGSSSNARPDPGFCPPGTSNRARPDRDVSARILTYFYPQTENNNPTIDCIQQQLLKAKVLTVKAGVVTARVHGFVRMQHVFYPRPDGCPTLGSRTSACSPLPRISHRLFSW